MKQEFDKQLDSLLRNTRGATDVRPADAFEHLSADELSAYAENALPQAARARYTAHLADCAACRRIVTAVTLAAGAEVVQDTRPATVAAAAASTPPWRARLAALFSPRALAYAAPVLALVIVGALALVVLRGRRDGEAPQVAQQPIAEVERPSSITQPAAPADTSQATAAGNANAAALEEQNARAAGQNNETAKTEATADAQARSKETVQEEEKKELAAVAKDSLDKFADADETSARPAPAKSAGPPPSPLEANQAASATAAAPAPAAVARAGEREDDEVVRQQRPAAESARKEEQREAAPRSAEPERGRRMDRDARDERSAYENKSKSDGSVSGDFATTNRKRSNETAGAGAGRAETRQVAGHEFRRQGDAWVDVNYRSSMSTVKIKRGSERFRSLAADLPEIGRAAEQLQGTVIIVVRGRPYRID